MSQSSKKEKKLRATPENKVNLTFKETVIKIARHSKEEENKGNTKKKE